MQPEETIIEQENAMELPAQITNQVREHVEKLRAANPKIRKIFPICVEGDEFDDKDLYIGYFRQPDFVMFSKYLTASNSNQAAAMRQLAKDCFLDGDKELVDDDSLFMFGLSARLMEIIKVRNSKLINLSKPGK